VEAAMFDQFVLGVAFLRTQVTSESLVFDLLWHLIRQTGLHRVNTFLVKLQLLRILESRGTVTALELEVSIFQYYTRHSEKKSFSNFQLLVISSVKQNI
jgi:hypothetical protein